MNDKYEKTMRRLLMNDKYKKPMILYIVKQITQEKKLGLYIKKKRHNSAIVF